jgi:lipopolysaccharide export system permease protein
VWAGVTGVLLLILPSYQLARVLAQAAADGFPRSTVFALLGLTSVQNLTIVLPVGLFLAIMLALGRLYHESEMAAIHSGGVGPAGLYKPVFALSGVVIALLVWISLDVGPAAALKAQQIQGEALKAAQFGHLEPGRFRSFAGGDIVFYAERVDENGVLYNVFVERNEGNQLQIVTAARAEQRNAGEAEQMFVLYEGERHEGVPGSAEFRIVRFSEHGIPIHMPEPNARRSRREQIPTPALAASADPRDVAELQWRISVPLMAVVLTLLAVPLSKLRPREGRYAKMGIAILIYFLYTTILGTARVWVEKSRVPEVLGMWWVHLLVFGVAMYLLVRQLGWQPFWMRRRAS